MGSTLQFRTPLFIVSGLSSIRHQREEWIKTSSLSLQHLTREGSQRGVRAKVILVIFQVACGTHGSISALILLIRQTQTCVIIWDVDQTDALQRD